MIQVKVPVEIAEAVSQGAVVSVSVSGGKDSQAMTRALAAAIPGKITEIVHADLGRAEWPQTSEHVRKIAAESGAPLRVVRRAKGDLVQRIEERLNQVSTLTGEPPAKPFWPSAAQRYCTSDLKRDPIAKQHRSHGPNGVIISCIGMRAEESPRRKQLPAVEIDKRTTSKRLRELPPADAVSLRQPDERLVLKWLPIHSWTVEQVWQWLGSTTADVQRRRLEYKAGNMAEAFGGWQGHPAYVYGNERLSCALCVLASVGDLCNGRDHNPELFEHYVQLERLSGYTFRNGLSLADLPSEGDQ